MGDSQTYSFSAGAFGDCGINDLTMYPNGLIVTSAVNTNVLDDFLADLLAWAALEFGLKETGIPPRERFYESAILVEMNVRVKKAFTYTGEIASTLTSYLQSYDLPNFAFDFGGISLAIDTSKYPGGKPIAFTLARRVNVPFEANIYYSTAPLTTEHHLELLGKVEGLLG